MVVSQQTAEALTALDLTVALTNFFIRLDDLVAKALVISFLVIVKNELADGAAERVAVERHRRLEIRHADSDVREALNLHPQAA